MAQSTLAFKGSDEILTQAMYQHGLSNINHQLLKKILLGISKEKSLYKRDYNKLLQSGADSKGSSLGRRFSTV